ncbi:hypothetical protein RHMOL_Rhmol03G0104300 [Rhododendron molle]|uniref:Uncharacterized protein n=1 Tax=Rhododendron molle TaxID=49168 RepID=A0ACC0PF39_RHOML|nr:hypothetical protein RHMOL_Rhmol03G0104300 [Rhododendron molle]
MERQAPFAGPNIDPYALAQMHQMAMQRMQQNGQGGNPAQSPYGGQMVDPKADSDKQTNKEPRPQAHEQDMDIGYEDKPSTPSFEGLEQSGLFQRIIEINAQYQEKLSSLRAQQAKRREEFLLKEAQARLHQYKQAASNHYPANASPIDPRSYGPKNVSPIDSRGHGPTNASSIDPRGPLDPRGCGPTTASPIDPHGYGPTNGGPIDPRGYGLTNAGPIDPRGYGGAAAAEAHRAYATGQFESSRERRPFTGGGRNLVPEARVPIPEGRVYNNMSARNH